MSQTSLDRAVRALLLRFRRQRPLRSGSLLITILGDAIAPRGGAVTLGSLIKLAQPFGLPERLVRTSVGRLALDGWLNPRRVGRQSEYSLTRHGRERFAEATQRIYSEPPTDWDRRWTMLLIHGPHRERIREEMTWLGFGQVAPGVLLHPWRSADDTQGQLRAIGTESHAIVLQATSYGLIQDRRLISTGWDLAELARGYRRFVAGFEPVRTVLSEGAKPSADVAFAIRTLLIHEYRKIHLRDPLLPRELLPDGWIGAEAYDLCQDLYRRMFVTAEAYLSSHAARLNGALEDFAPKALQRFGGLPRR